MTGYNVPRYIPWGTTKSTAAKNQQNIDSNVELLMQNVFSEVQNAKKILKRIVWRFGRNTHLVSGEEVETDHPQNRLLNIQPKPAAWELNVAKEMTGKLAANTA